jgi:hypothetical protein
VQLAEFPLGPDAQCAWPTPVASARPTATRAWSALAGPASADAARAAHVRGARRVRAAALPGGARLGTGTWETAGAAAHRCGDGGARAEIIQEEHVPPRVKYGRDLT